MKSRAATYEAMEAQYHQLMDEVLTTLERLQADPYAPIDPGIETQLRRHLNKVRSLGDRLNAIDDASQPAERVIP